MILGENVGSVYSKGREIQRVFSYGKLVWEKEPIDYTIKPFTVKAIADDVSVKLRGVEGKIINYKYSLNGGSWIETDTSTTIYINKNDEVSFIGIYTIIDGTTQQIKYCDIIGLSDVCGNIMSLGHYDDFIGKTYWGNVYQMDDFGFFTNCDIRNAKNLILPATEFSSWGYANMFRNCKSLITPPKISYPSSAAEYCYYRMFENCTSLKTTPPLSATSLRKGSYYRMFYGCTSLTTAHNLSAKFLAEDCCFQMFYGCTSLTTAPELPSTTLAKRCYDSMFENCSNLNYIKCYARYNMNSTNLSEFAKGVSPTGKLVCYEEAADVFRDYIPSTWTIEYLT